MNGVQWTILIFCMVLNVACSSDSSDTDDEVVENIESSGLTMQYSPKSYEKKPLNEENVESVVENAAEILAYFISVNEEFSEADESSENNPVITQEYNYKGYEASSRECVEGGGIESIMYAYSKLKHDESRVWGAGDRISETYDECGDVIDGISLSKDGQYDFEVVRGVYDGGQFLEVPTKVVHSYNDFGIYDASTQYTYYHGSFTEEVTLESRSMTSDNYSVYDISNGKIIEFTAKNLNIMITDDKGDNPLIEVFKLSFDETLNLTLAGSEINVDVSLVEPIIENRGLSSLPNSGVVEVQGKIGNVKITFKDGFLDYALDKESDGDYEIFGMIDDYRY